MNTAPFRSSTGLYLHLPFCEKRCYYCDFSTAAFRPNLVRKYLTAFHAEIDQVVTYFPHTTIQTVFFGGGTPSLHSAEELVAIFEHLHRTFTIYPAAEITCETNPENLTADKLHHLKTLGVNRLSIGVQSFHDHHLQRIGRVHNAATAIGAYHRARHAGFENINIDLMFALPDQTLSEVERDLDQLIDLAPEHISAYSLIVEDKTLFGKQLRQGQFVPMEEDLEAQMYEMVIDRLTTARYLHYEISNFARPGFACAHNLGYWAGGDYLGIGAGAHSHRQGHRWANEGNVSKYVRRMQAGESPVVMEEHLSREQQMAEIVFLALRTRNGIQITDFQRRFGVKIDTVYGETLETLQQRGLIQRTPERIQLTRQGLLLADAVCSEFMAL
ncbi:MAG: radical SAM family heme chaperone HemW [Gemmatimonadetes bacterium]|nr:MAG: radical SAM family heme chaperone HemW [Gemmatimonadota bacterium]